MNKATGLTVSGRNGFRKSAGSLAILILFAVCFPALLFAAPADFTTDKEGNDALKNTGKLPAGKHPIDLVFVIDESNSMEFNLFGTNNDPKRIRVDAAKKFTKDLSAGDRAAVVGFSNAARLLVGLESDMDAVRTYIDKISGSRGATQIHHGINVALEELITNSSSGNQKVIIVLTDGEDSPAVPVSEYDAIIDRAKASNISIYTITLGPDVDQPLMNRIASETGGKYYHAEDADSIYEEFELVKGAIFSADNGAGLLAKIMAFLKDNLLLVAGVAVAAVLVVACVIILLLRLKK